MKRFWTRTIFPLKTARYLSLTLLTVTALTTTPALALEYTETDMSAVSFGDPTSIEQVLTIGGTNPYETDVSKNAAFIPPVFGSPMADMLGAGERLTPNLPGYDLVYGGVSAESSAATSGSSVTIMPPALENGTAGQVSSSGYTPVTNDLYYKGGHLGTVSAPAIGLNAKIYKGTRTMRQCRKVWDTSQRLQSGTETQHSPDITGVLPTISARSISWRMAIPLS